MSLITHKHSQQIVEQRAVDRAVSTVTRMLTQAGVASTPGIPARSKPSGFYDEDGNYGRFKRPGDPVNSSHPLAP